MTKNLMYLVAAAMIIFGLVGFVNDPIFGIFDVDVLHNLIHLVSGILIVVFARQGDAQTRKIGLILGVVFALVTILGFMVGDGKILGLVAVNGADNILHLVFTVILLFVGLKKSSSGSSSMSM